MEDDPVKELRRYRKELSERFPTTKEMSDYFASIPPVEVILADLRRQIAEKKDRRKRKVPVPPVQQRSAERKVEIDE